MGSNSGSDLNFNITAETKQLKADLDRAHKLIAELQARVSKSAEDAAAKAEKASEKAKRALNKQGKETKKLGKVSEFAVNRLTKLSRVIAVIQGPLGPVAGRLTAMASAVRNMGAGALVAGLAFGGLGAAMRRAIPAAIEMQRTMSVLSAATGDAAASLKMVIAESRRTGQQFSELAKGYAQLAAAARGTTLEGKGVQSMFKAINTAALALRLDVNQTKGALKALEQMISKGTVSSEEMRQQLGERLPGAFRLAADAAGLTTAEFSKQLAQGKILAEDLLPKLAAAIEDAYGASAANATNNLGVSLDRLSSETNVFFAKLVKSNVLNKFVNTVNMATDAMKLFGDALSTSGDNVISYGNVLSLLANIIGFTLVAAVLNLGKKITALNVIVETTSVASMTWKKTMIKSMSLVQKAWFNLSAVFVAGGKAISAAVMGIPIVGWAAAAAIGITTVIDIMDNKLTAKMKKLGDFTTEGIRRRIKENEAAIAKTEEQFRRLEGRKQRGSISISGVKRLAELRKMREELRRNNELEGKALQHAISNDDAIIASKQRVSAAVEGRNAAVTKALEKMTTTANERLGNTLNAAKKSITENIAKLKVALSEARADAATASSSARNNSGSIQLQEEAAAAHKVVIELKNKLRVQKESLAITEKDIVRLKPLLDKEEKARQRADASKARSAATAHARVEAAKVASIAAMEEVEIQRKLFAADSGSLERLMLKQTLARKQFEAKTKIALEKAVGEEAKKAVLASASVEQAALEERLQAQRDAFDKEQHINALRLDQIKQSTAEASRVIINGTVDAQRARSKIQEGTTGIHDLSGDLQRQLQRIDDAAAAKQAEIQKQFEITVEQNLNNAAALDEALATREAASNEAELQRKRAHAEAVLAIEQKREEDIRGLRQAFSTIGRADQDINFEGLINGLKAFGERAAQVDKMTTKGKLNLAKQGFDALTGLMSSGNRKMFEVGKAASIAKTIVNTIDMSIDAFKSVQASMPGNPAATALAAVAAAGVAAMGYQKVQQIAAVKMGSSSAGNISGGFSTGAGARTSSIAPAAPAAPAAPVAFDPTYNPTAAAGNTPTPQGVTIIQNITAANATAGTSQLIADAAAAATQQAVATVAADFATNGTLRQTLGV